MTVGLNMEVVDDRFNKSIKTKGIKKASFEITLHSLFEINHKVD